MWQKEALEEITRPQSPRLRVSNASKCILRQAYARTGHQETDLPDQKSENIMAMGHMAEVLIIKNMHEAGWETDHTVLSDSGQLDLSIDLGDGIFISGHPDGICRHPEFTNNLWVTLECKSMGVDKAFDVDRYGIPKVYPGYITQIGLYARELHNQGLVSHPTKGVFGIMSREGDFIPPERLSWKAETIDEAVEKVRKAVEIAERTHFIPPPFEKDSTECKYCPYFSACWGESPELRPGFRPLTERVDDSEVDRAAFLWKEGKTDIDTAKGILMTESDARDGATVATNGVLAGYFTPRNPPVYDSKALRRFVPADILRRCLASKQKAEKPAFWIRREY